MLYSVHPVVDPMVDPVVDLFFFSFGEKPGCACG